MFTCLLYDFHFNLLDVGFNCANVLITGENQQKFYNKLGAVKNLKNEAEINKKLRSNLYMYIS